MSDGVEWSLLSTLSVADRERLLAAAQRRSFKAREVVFHAGDPGDAIFVIGSGHVAVRVVTEQGDAVTLVVLGPGDTFGDLALFSNDARRSATIVALEPTQTWTLSRAQLLAVRSRYPAIDQQLIELLAQRVDRLTGQLVEALYVPVRHRVVRVVLRLIEQYQAGHAQQESSPTVTLLVTQDDVAALTGASRPSVNQVLRALEADGAVVLGRGRIEVIDTSVLTRHRG